MQVAKDRVENIIYRNGEFGNYFGDFETQKQPIVTCSETQSIFSLLKKKLSNIFRHCQ